MAQAPDDTVQRHLVLQGPGGQVLLIDSITLLGPADAGVLAVSASHGGSSSGAFALAQPLSAAFFNDAGVGKDDAGIAALALLQARGVPAGTVAHTSARIGDAADTWAHGVLSHLNDAARARGLRPGQRLQEALTAWVLPDNPAVPRSTDCSAGIAKRRD